MNRELSAFIVANYIQKLQKAFLENWIIMSEVHSLCQFYEHIWPINNWIKSEAFVWERDEIAILIAIWHIYGLDEFKEETRPDGH